MNGRFLGSVECMTEQVVMELQEMTEIIESEAIVRCRSCGKVVPKTNMCLYCGAPILFKKPTQLER